MKDKAIAKITEEAGKIDDPIATGIEEYLTNRCTDDETAAAILKEDRKLKEIYDRAWEEAKKRKKGNVAVLSDEEVFAMVDDYYGLSRKPAPSAAPPERVNVLDLF